jgi:DNA ligase-1
VGVYEQSAQRYLTIAKIGTGMTDEEWKTLKANSEKRIAKSKPDEYTVAKEMECDVWVHPHIVLEVRSDEITQSKIHTSGWSLRFPRLERFRADKRPHDATTKDEIDTLAVSQKN